MLCTFYLFYLASINYFRCIVLLCLISEKCLRYSARLMRHHPLDTEAGSMSLGQFAAFHLFIITLCCLCGPALCSRIPALRRKEHGQYCFCYLTFCIITCLRPTAGTAKRVLAMVILSVRPSVCLSVCPSRPGTESSPSVIETPGFHRMIA